MLGFLNSKLCYLMLSPGGRSPLGSNISTFCGAASLQLILCSLLILSGVRERGQEQAPDLVTAWSGKVDFLWLETPYVITQVVIEPLFTVFPMVLNTIEET